MKRTLWILTLLFLVHNTLAQAGKYNAVDKGKKLEGYIVKSNFDTLKGYIYVDMPYVMETNITFSRDGSENNGSIFRPSDLIMYKVGSMEWFSSKHCDLKVPKPVMGQNDVFINASVSGPISLFDYYVVKEDDPNGFSSTYYMQTTKKELVDVSGLMLGFKSSMPKYLVGNKELGQKISNKEKGYKFLNIQKIVRKYNKWFLKNNPDFNFVLTAIPDKSYTSLPTEEKYEGEWKTFDGYSGIQFRLSQPYMRYQPWDTEKTGNANFAIGLQLKNNSGKNLRQINFKVKIYDKQGNIISESSNSTGPMVFDPQKGHVIPTNYTGHYDSFVSKGADMAGKFGRVEYMLMDVKFEE